MKRPIGQGLVGSQMQTLWINYPSAHQCVSPTGKLTQALGILSSSLGFIHRDD